MILFSFQTLLYFTVIELELIWKPSSWELAFVVPEGIMQASKGGTQSVVFFNYDAHEPWQPPARHDNPAGV